MINANKLYNYGLWIMNRILSKLFITFLILVLSL